MKFHHLILLLALAALALLAIARLNGISLTPQASKATTINADDPNSLGPQGYHNAIRADVEFEAPYRLRTIDGEYVSVESPGYASPTLVDIDDDGDSDLIVGQFAGGNMQLYRNASGVESDPTFDRPQWITSDGRRAEVPGVS